VTGEVALALEGVHKRFGSVAALDGASLEVRAGEVHALLGQNGSGKSTLIKVLTGFHAPDAVRRAEVWGRPLQLPVPDARRQGIAVIHQDLALLDALTVTENLGISTGFGRSPFARIRWKREREQAVDVLAELGVRADPDAPVGDLPPADRAAVAVGRALLELRAHPGRALLVLDEPTAYLPAEEAERVMALMRSVAASGAAVVFISHRLAEVMAVCDRATILRDGRTVGRVEVAGSSPREMIRMMLGRELGEFYPPKREPQPGGEVLRARDLSARVLRDVSFALRVGEIVGVTGLVGQGQQELPYVLDGVRSHRGEVLLRGEPLRGDPRARLRAGLVLVPANRKRDAVWLDATARENITLPRLGDHLARGVLRPRLEASHARELMERLGVRPVDPERPVAGFSGGNQQKIVLAKWLQCGPRVLVLEEPTQGVDAGAKREIFELLQREAAAGAGILLCSSDTEEIANVCHRVLVLAGGRVIAELRGDDVTEQAILEHCNAGITTIEEAA
jgi:ribose transport system ATP-binding protein